jgi:hypothetical protein
VNFLYALFDGDTSGAAAVGANPLCQTQIGWGGVSGGSGNLNISCTQTVVPTMTSTATYTTTTTVSGGPQYYTYTAPDNISQYPNGPPSSWVWATPPPPITLTIPGATKYLYIPPSTTVTVTKNATIVPFYISFVASDGTSNNTSTYKANVNQQYPPFNTFVDFGFLKPHMTYTAILYAQTSGSLGDNQNGPYNNMQPVGQPQTLNKCLSASLTSPAVCGGGTSPQTVPGGQAASTYTLWITNLTNKTFDSNFGYQMAAFPDGGGLVAAGSMTQSLTIPPTTNAVQATFTFTVRYQGTYSVAFQFQGSTISGLPVDGWDGTCGGPTIIPRVTPYFQVWNGDAAAGGGFKTVANQCSSTYPDYVSPVTASSKPNSETYGGIRAISGSTYKSQADFGAIALGIIPSANGGFMAKKAYFSNNKNSVAGTSINGGYLDSNSAGHCVPDYYTKTRFADEANTPGLPGGDLNQAINACTPDAVTQYRRCQYQASGAYLSGPAITIPQGVQLTLYVDGDVTIDTDIRYAEPFDLSSRANIPYLTIIAKGNIFITSNVTRLDGLYVAQPSSSGNDGDFNTCSDDSCPRQLVINGAVIARHVKLMRSHGASQSLNNDINGIGNTPAEIINFTPAMILGAPAFSPASTSPEGLFSLPPVF